MDILKDHDLIGLDSCLWIYPSNLPTVDKTNTASCEFWTVLCGGF
jgi:hypothetical protein